MKRPLILLIRDGWGIGEDYDGNAVKFAKTPVMDRLLAGYPRCALQAAGEGVGLRPGAQGSSEVGHLNMGAGRIVEQEIVRVDKALESGELFDNPLLKDAVRDCASKGSKFHLMGLVQDQGVHATEEHLYAFLEFAARQNLKNVHIHFFSDGRDTSPRSALTYLERLEKRIRSAGVGRVSSVMGRYYAMDRGQNWGRTARAYNALVHGKGLKAASAREAIAAAYERADKTPADCDEPAETDEFIQPTLILDEGGDWPGIIQNGDAVVHFNYRQDRAVQLTKAFVEPDFSEFDRGVTPDINYMGLTRYYDEFKCPLIPPMSMSGLLGEVLSDHRLWQLRISEYQKYRHVTSFFNGKLVKPFACEDRAQVDSITIPENHKPEMSAYEVTELMTAAIDGGIRGVRNLAAHRNAVTPAFDIYSECKDERIKDAYDVIVLNYANCDMVGHTGDFKAGIKAVEVVDECVGKVVERALARDGVTLVTADHGNVEQMLDMETGKVQTAHSTNDVDFVLVAGNAENFKLKKRGKLADIAPTMLELLEIPAPPEMTAASLIESRKP